MAGAWWAPTRIYSSSTSTTNSPKKLEKPQRRSKRGRRLESVQPKLTNPHVFQTDSLVNIILLIGRDVKRNRTELRYRAFAEEGLTEDAPPGFDNAGALAGDVHGRGHHVGDRGGKKPCESCGDAGIFLRARRWRRLRWRLPCLRSRSRYQCRCPMFAAAGRSLRERR